MGMDPSRTTCQSYGTHILFIHNTELESYGRASTGKTETNGEASDSCYSSLCTEHHQYLYKCSLIIYSWSALSSEYGSTGYGCQFCSWFAEQGKIGKTNFSLCPSPLENLVSRDGFSRPVQRQSVHSSRDREISIFPVQLTTSRIGNLTSLIHNLLYVMTIHTYSG